MALSYKMIFNVDVAPLNDKIVHSKSEESLTSCGSGLPETPTTAVPLPLHGRARSDSVNSLTSGGHNAYSDSSDLNVSLADEVDDAKGKGKQRLRGHAHSGSINTIGTTGTTETAIASGSGFPFNDRPPTPNKPSSLAAQLQSALYPPPPEDPLDMVGWILVETSPNQETSTGSMGGGREGNTSAMADLDTLIENVFASVRGLSYVCGDGPSTTGGRVGGSRENGVIAAGGGGGWEALVPKIMVGITPTIAFTYISASAASPYASTLAPTPRKLTATLSRLVLSTRAIRYDSANVSPESTIERIRGDATELGRAIGAFGVEVQKALDKLDRLNEDELYQRQINLNLTSNIDLAPMLLKLNLNPTLLSLSKKHSTAAFEPTN
ncbi:hypothetical protein EV359DRAFT_86779 [Lentinula novae-zelandiae]|nr:hypothetical protein EV359DRAFT_86779 [Lentinula novae-zelandiae]